MSTDPGLRNVPIVSRPIDNSRVVREMDPRAHRDLWLTLILVLALVGAAGLYAWPHLQYRQSLLETQSMLRERERLKEENRKLRLERASLEDLARIEAIARRDLGLVAPDPNHVVVVEEAAPAPAGTHVATGPAPAAASY